MKRILLFGTLFLLLFFLFITPVYAQQTPSCKSINVSYSTNPGSPIPENAPSMEVSFSRVDNNRYRLRLGYLNCIGSQCTVYSSEASAADGNLTLVIDNPRGKGQIGGSNHVGTLEYFNTSENTWREYCGDVSYQVGFGLLTCEISYLRRDPKVGEQIEVTVSKISTSFQYGLYFFEEPDNKLTNIIVDSSGTGKVTIGPFQVPFTKTLAVGNANELANLSYCKTTLRVVSGAGATPRPLPTPRASGGTISPGITPGPASGQRCTNAGDGVQTAIGCIPTDPIAFVRGLVRYTTLIGGGVALLLMISGAFKMITSSGNAEALKNGQDQFRAAIIGLLFVIFTLTLLRIIGVDILNIPGIRK